MVPPRIICSDFYPHQTQPNQTAMKIRKQHFVEQRSTEIIKTHTDQTYFRKAVFISQVQYRSTDLSIDFYILKYPII